GGTLSGTWVTNANTATTVTGLTIAGTLDVAASGDTLEIDGTTNAVTVNTGAGIQAGDTAVSSGITIDGNVTNNGTIRTNTSGANHITIKSDAVITNTGTLQTSGAGQLYIQGTVNGGKVTRMNSGGSVFLDGGTLNGVTLSGNINAATATTTTLENMSYGTSGGINNPQMTIDTSAVLSLSSFTILSTGTIQADGTATMTGNFINAGSLKTNNTSGNLLLDSNASLTNSGTITANQGTLTIAGTVTNNSGTISSTGGT